MGYVEYLRDVLRPLHIYDLDNGAGAAEIYALGTALNGIYDELETLLREMIPVTAEDYGLDSFEDMLAYKPVYENGEDRRKAIAALNSPGGVSLDEINRSIMGIGIKAEVSELGTETVSVSFPNNPGTPGNIDELKARIEQIIPCHLDIVYETVYITWRMLNLESFTWQSFEYEEFTWLSLQMYDVGY